jgi:hypothetical protein
MSKRFLLLGIVLGLLVMLAGSNLRDEASSVFDVFFWLMLLLVVAGLALWPSSGRDQKAELGLERRGWADRIEFERGPKPGGSSASARARDAA